MFASLDKIDFHQLVPLTQIFRKLYQFYLSRNIFLALHHASNNFELVSNTGFIPVYTATVRRSRPPDLLTHGYSKHDPADIEYR